MRFFLGVGICIWRRYGQTRAFERYHTIGTLRGSSGTTLYGYGVKAGVKGA